VYPNATSLASEKWASSYGAAPTTATGIGRRSAPTDAGTVTAGGGGTPTGSASTSETTGVAGLLPPYPKVVKIEERRMPRGAHDQPYCVQMLISADGTTAVPVRKGDGSAVVVVLDERVGAVGSAKAQECHCGWVAK
jgi:hypothetical protein